MLNSLQVYFICITILGIMTAAPSAASTEVDAYLLFGQSNAAGRSMASELTDTSLAQHYSQGIDFAYREKNFSTGTTDGDLGMGAIRPHGANSMVGSEITLGRQLAQNSANHVMLVSFVSGGTAIANFLPETNNLYQPMVNYAVEREAEILSKGFTKVNWKAVFVVTGESDSGTAHPFALFPERLLSIRDSLETDLDTPVLPMVFGQLKANWIDTPTAFYSGLNGGASHINNQLQIIADSDPTLALTISNADLDTRFTAGLSTGDGIHYSADAYAILGERLYTAYSNLPQIPEPTSGLMLLSASCLSLMVNRSPTWSR